MKTRLAKILSLTGTCAALAFAHTSLAAPKASRIAIGANAGTTGLGASVWITASPKWVVKLGYDSYDTDESYETDEVDYNGNIDLSNGFAMLEWHPGAGGFYLSAGAVATSNKVGVTGNPRNGTTFEFDGTVYSASDVGSVVGTVEWENSVAPYLGLGWSKKPDSKGWGSFIELGVMQSGSAQAELTATGPIASQPAFIADLEAEERELNDELDEFELYPVARIGLMYRF